jgi:hypothetical protein
MPLGSGSGTRKCEVILISITKALFRKNNLDVETSSKRMDFSRFHCLMLLFPSRCATSEVSYLPRFSFQTLFRFDAAELRTCPKHNRNTILVGPICDVIDHNVNHLKCLKLCVNQGHVCGSEFVARKASSTSMEAEMMKLDDNAIGSTKEGSKTVF